MTNQGFQLAVGIEHWNGGVKNDPYFLKWVVQHYYMDDDGKYHIEEYPMKKCEE